MGKVYGYVRVSSKDQNIHRQIDALAKYNIPNKSIFVDKQSGKDFNRPQYRRLLSLLREGDLIIVKSIDRLGRDYDEILAQWRLITKEIKADIVVADIPLLDTRCKEDDLTGKLIADIVLELLSYVAQAEREAIKERQAEGIASAKARGVKFGRKPVALPEEFEEICKRYSTGKITMRQAGEILGISAATFSRRYKEYNKK